MKQPEIKCPYCGTVMSPEYGHRRGMSYACPNCWSESPFITYKGGVDTAALCYEAALRRPLQKPLTKEELLALIGTGDEAVTWCEAKGEGCAWANIWTGEKVIGGDCSIISKDHIVYATYGKTWRAWASRPTDEERAAAPWEG